MDYLMIHIAVKGLNDLKAIMYKLNIMNAGQLSKIETQ